MRLAPLHRALLRTPTAPPVDLTGKKVIVTGAAPGSIGGETAKRLAQWGAEVITTTRSASTSTRSEHPLDLSDAGSVRAFAAWYAATHGDHLDVLVNNAGVHLDLMSSWKEPQLLDGFESHWRINYLGTMHLTAVLLPVLTATPGARVVNLVSLLHKRGTNEGILTPPTAYSSWTAYGMSKLALIHATKELHRRHPSVGAVSVHPGAVYTDIATKGLAEHPRVLRLREALKPVEAFFLLTAEEGAQTSVFTASQPGLEQGAYYVRCKLTEPLADANDATVSAKLWDQTQEWLSTVSA